MSIEAMKQALEALEHSHATEPMWKTPIKNAIASLRQAIAEAEKQEPVAFRCGDAIVHIKPPVYGNTHPQPKREWVGLTDEEIAELHHEIKVRLMGTFKIEDIYRAVEAKLRSKNTWSS